jgi:monoamine oxidase
MARTPLFCALVRALQAARRENLEARGLPPPINKNEAGWTRRQFVSSTLAVGGLTAVTSKLSATTQLVSTKSSSELPRIAIVGGGIAGLNAAYQLKKVGLNPMVYEASRRLGGRIFTGAGIVSEGLITELGGEFINSDHADMLGLVNEFDLQLFNRVEDGEQSGFPTTGFYFNGKSHSEDEITNLLRPLAAQIDSDANLLDQEYDGYASQFDALSTTEYLDQHNTLIPEPFVRTLIENSIRVEFGVEPDASSALQLIRNLPTVDGQRVEILGNSDKAFVVNGGNAGIIKGLVQALNGHIHTEMPLTKLEHLRRERFRLTFVNGTTTDADYVIVAVPFTALRNVELEIALPRNLRRFIDEVSLGRNEKFIAGFREKVWRNPNGFVTDAWSDLGFSEVWDATQPQPDRKDGALTFYLGSNEVAKAKAQFPENDTLGKALLDRLNDFIPGSSEAATGKFVRTQWIHNPWIRGTNTSFAPGQRTRFGELFWIESDDSAKQQEVRAGNLLFAGEHVSDESFGSMNGGAQTGRLAANAVVQSIVAEIKAQKSNTF